ncbi:MAG: T9SS type A sorting domain-containing protein [Clostridia bacterium]|nr:T9SS type A sorting domain-containing protein [Clostridia bacterium]
MKLLRTTLLPMILLAFILSGSLCLSGQAGLHFKNLTIETPANANDYLATANIADEQMFNGSFYKIVQFEQIPTVDQRQELAMAGIRLLDYIPEKGYFAAFRNDFTHVDADAFQMRSIIDISPAIKLAPMLYAGSYPDYALRANGKISLLVSIFPNVEAEIAYQALLKQNIEVAAPAEGAEFFSVICNIDQIKQLAALPFVVYLEPMYPEPEPENYTGRTLHRGNAIASDLSAGRHYDGTGVNVMLQDDGNIGPHIDFAGRIGNQYVGYFGGDHGDHCAGIIAAAGNIDPHARGNAFGATLYVYGAAPEYPGFTQIPSHYFSNQIRVTSTSYSNGCNAGYTSLARLLDVQINLYPALMHVFSAGNDGTSDCNYGAGPGWGNITGGHKVAKNVMTVANLDEMDNLSSSSSRGPAHDGRIKPDISAKGSDVYSTLPDDEYGFKSGTSMSCPGVAGVMAQLFDAYRQLSGGTDPLGGLLKGIVLNTAEDLGNQGPDFRFGWGRINALRAVKVLEDSRYDSATIETGQTLIHNFEVPENTAQMRVMVYWTDYQSSVNTNWALVNNLDITVADPESTVWQPWVLNHYPHPDSLNKTAIRGIDDRNNMEQVTLDAPAAGTYSLSVEGTNVPQGPQKYYIIFEFIPEAVVLTYPAGGEQLTPGTKELIRWDAFGNDETFNIELSIDNGTTWELVKDNIAANARAFEWDVPNAASGQIWMRISRGEYTSQTPGAFSIMAVPRSLAIDWACENALHLSWIEVPEATEYTIYQLGEKYMEPIATTTINSFIVDNINSSGTFWFSVSASGLNDAKSMRANAIKKSPGTFQCHQSDAWLTAAPSVDWGLFQSCMNIEALEVTVEMKNFGIEPITDPEFGFQLDEGVVIVETYFGTIQPDSSILFTFSDPISIVEIGEYVLKTWVSYASDENPDNNLLVTNLEVIEGAVFLPGNTQTFENFENCIPAPLCELLNCPLSENWINLTNQEKDDVDWRVWHGGTSTYNTGPSADHTTGTSDGKYLYTEPSVICFDKLATMMSPCIDLTNGVSPALDFWVHAYGADIGRLHVDIFDGSATRRDIMPPIIGNQGNEWKNIVADLTEYNGKKIGLRFRVYTSGGQRGDLAIDDIAITDVTAIGNHNIGDGALNLYPNPTNGLVNVTLENAGTEKFALEVLDIYGRTVYTKAFAPIDGRIVHALDLSGLPGGVYFVRLVSQSNSYNTKLTIR